VPELTEEEGSPESEPASDEEELALQWLSEPPPEFGRHLSGFGQVFMLLDGMVTEHTSLFLKGKQSTASAELPLHSNMQVSSRASLREQGSSLWLGRHCS
jgi:hypothetical protein